MIFRGEVEVSERIEKPIESQVGFRIMDNTSNIDPCSLARRIDFLFDGYTFTRGQIKCSYWHPELGYRMNCLVDNEQIAIELFDRVLQIQYHQFDASKFSVNEMPYRQFRSDPAMRRERPNGVVKFLNAELKNHGQLDFILVDKGGRRKSILEDETCE